METNIFRNMWDHMQKEGYFRKHPHYTDWHENAEDAKEFDPDTVDLGADPEPILNGIDFSKEDLVIDNDFSLELRRALKRNEYYWLPRMFDLPPAGTVLDLGCGYGRSLEWLHKVYDRSIGVDISDYVIDIAKKRFRSIDNVSFFSSDGVSFPRDIKDESIDFIYCFTVFQHIPREFTVRYLKECRRVLKPEGKIIFNLISGINEDVDEGEPGTEWVIGYGIEQARLLADRVGLKFTRINRWRATKMNASWLWVEAIK